MLSHLAGINLYFSRSRPSYLSSLEETEAEVLVRNSLLFLSPEVWFDDQTVHCQIDDQRPHGGIEHSTGKQLIR